MHTVSMKCPACEKRLSVPDTLIGRTVRCPGCGERFKSAVPSPERAKLNDLPEEDEFGDREPRPSRPVSAMGKGGLLIVGGITILVVGLAIVGVIFLSGRRTEPVPEPVAVANAHTPGPSTTPPAVNTIQPSDPRPTTPPPEPARPKAAQIKWPIVLEEARKKAKAILTAGEAEDFTIDAVTAKRSAIRLGILSPAERDAALAAALRVKEKGIQNVDPLTLEFAEKIVPADMALMRIGTPAASNTGREFETALLRYPTAVRLSDLEEEAGQQGRGTDPEVVEMLVARALYRRASPPAISDFRRLQIAGLHRIACAGAIKSGMNYLGESQPSWFTKRTETGFAIDLQTERDLLFAAWACFGTMPDAFRANFAEKLIDGLDRAGANRNTVIEIGRSTLLAPLPLSAQETKLQTTLKGHTFSVNSVTYSPDGKTLASGSKDKTIKLWDVSTGVERTVLNGHTGTVSSLAYSPDGKTLASGSVDEKIKLWDVAMGKELATLTGHKHWVRSVAFSPDGKTLASGSLDTTIKLWDVATGKEQVTLKGHAGEVNSVAFSPDGKTLASGGGSLDGTIKSIN